MNHEHPQHETAPDAGHEALSDALQLSFRLLRWGMVLLLLGYLASGVFVVQQDERAFVLLFGKIHGAGEQRIREPGLHWTWPRPLTEIVRVPTGRENTLHTTRFWHANDATQAPSKPRALAPGRTGYTISADANLVHLRWALRYRINDPEAWAFGFDNPASVVSNTFERCVLHVTANADIDTALRSGNTARERIRSELRDQLERLGTGIEITGLDLESAAPPAAVQSAFDAAIQSELEASRTVLEAETTALKRRSSASAEAEQLRLEAQAEANAFLADLQADVASFQALRQAWNERPAITAQTLKLQTLRRVLAQVDEKHLLYPREGARELRLLLSPQRNPNTSQRNPNTSQRNPNTSQRNPSTSEGSSP